jgi:hypothetical protein
MDARLVTKSGTRYLMRAIGADEVASAAPNARPPGKPAQSAVTRSLFPEMDLLAHKSRS